MAEKERFMNAFAVESSASICSIMAESAWLEVILVSHSIAPNHCNKRTGLVPSHFAGLPGQL